MKTAHALFRLMRTHQWIKNGFVFVGLIFAHDWSEPGLARLVFTAFAAMCLASSSLYIFNDLIDRPMDAKHPVKRHRPLAAGDVQPPAAILCSVTLLALSVGLAFYGSRHIAAFIVLYLVLEGFYTLKLKHVVLLDIFTISAGFMIRILVGTLGVGIPPSQWLLFCGFMLTIFLGFTKRRSEINALEDNAGSHRPVLARYSPILLDNMIGISAACAIMSYSLYTISSETVQKHGTKNLIYTVPLVVYGIFRYIYLLHNGKGTDAAMDVVDDPHLRVVLLLWVATVSFLIL